MEITLSQHPAIYNRVKGRLFSAHTYNVAKPDPGLFQIALKTLGFSAAEAVVIDDSPSGCAAAQAAGIRCLGLAEHGHGHRLIAVGADVITSLREVPEKLGL